MSNATGGCGALGTSDSTRIAYFRIDDRGVDTMPIVHWLETHELVDTIDIRASGVRIPQVAPVSGTCSSRGWEPTTGS